MIGQNLLIQVDEAFARRLGDEDITENGVASQSAVEAVKGLRLHGDQAGFGCGAPAGIHEDIACGDVGTRRNDEQVGRVGLNRRLVQCPDVEDVRVNDGETSGFRDQGVEADAQARAVGQGCRSVDAETGVGARCGVERHNQIAVGTDVQACGPGNGRLTGIERSVGDIDRQQAVGVRDRSPHDRAAGD